MKTSFELSFGALIRGKKSHMATSADVRRLVAKYTEYLALVLGTYTGLSIGFYVHIKNAGQELVSRFHHFILTQIITDGLFDLVRAVRSNSTPIWHIEFSPICTFDRILFFTGNVFTMDPTSLQPYHQRGVCTIHATCILISSLLLSKLLAHTLVS